MASTIERPQSKSADISQLAPRIDLKDKVTGQAQYVEDLPDLPNTASNVSLKTLIISRTWPAW